MVHFSIKISFYPVALLGMLEAIAMRLLQTFKFCYAFYFIQNGMGYLKCGTA